MRMFRGACFLLATGLSACGQPTSFPREARRPVTAAPSPLVIAGDSTAPWVRGGGVDDDNGSSIVVEATAGTQSPLGLYVTRHTIDGWTALTPAIPGFDAWHAGANISPDGSRLYFESNRRIPAVPGRVDTDLWTA